MEYVRIVTNDLKEGREIASSVVMPVFIGNLLYATQLISPAQEILDKFSTTEIVKCKPEEFNANNFVLYMQFKNNEIDEEEFYNKLEK